MSRPAWHGSIQISRNFSLGAPRFSPTRHAAKRACPLGPETEVNGGIPACPETARLRPVAATAGWP